MRLRRAGTIFQYIPTYSNLVGGLEHFLFFHILGIIIPTDEVIFFRGVGLNHQPANIFSSLSHISDHESMSPYVFHEGFAGIPEIPRVLDDHDPWLHCNLWLQQVWKGWHNWPGHPVLKSSKMGLIKKKTHIQYLVSFLCFVAFLNNQTINGPFVPSLYSNYSIWYCQMIIINCDDYQ